MLAPFCCKCCPYYMVIRVTSRLLLLAACPANQVFNDCCHLKGCDRNCQNKDVSLACPEVCVARCCCPFENGQQMILADDGVTCISRDQCPVTNLCAAVLCLVGFDCDPDTGNCFPTGKVLHRS